MERSISNIQEFDEFDDGQWAAVRTHHSLPPADGGRAAWLFLSSCFVLEAFTWGFPFSYGVFQAWYRDHEPFADDPAGVAAIGTVQTGVMYFSCSVVSLVLQRWPQLRRPGMYLGAALMVTSLIAASFVNSVPGLIATQGVVYGLGGSILYFPTIIYIDEWFNRRKGIAMGVMWAGTGSAGVVVPFLLKWLLHEYGFRTALRVWSIIMAIALTPCLFFVKGRLPITAANALRPVDLTFLRRPSFWLFEVGSIVQSLGFFLPALWIPSFALAIGLPSIAGPLGLALLNLAACFGAILTGLLVDRFHVSVAILVSTVGQMIAIFVFWGLTSSQAMLYAFALLWGVFGGGFSATWSGYPGALKKKHPNDNIDNGFVFALMGAGRGCGAVICGPLSESLLAMDWHSHASFAYGTAYGALIIFSGMSVTFGGMAVVGRVLALV